MAMILPAGRRFYILAAGIEMGLVFSEKRPTKEA
jgi:hypothetical protein